MPTDVKGHRVVRFLVSVLTAVLVVSQASLPALAQGFYRTFIPQWHLGDEWEVVEETDETTPDGRTGQRTNTYWFRVLAMETVAPGVRQVHVSATAEKPRGWDTAHLIFTWFLPAKFDATTERLCYTRLIIRRSGEAAPAPSGVPGKAPPATTPPARTPPPDDQGRLAVLDFAALSPEPYPVLGFVAPMPVSFPLFSLAAVSGKRTEEFSPPKREGAPKAPTAVRQVITGDPRLPEGRIDVPMAGHHPLEYRLEARQDPLTAVTQIWDAEYPWCVFERSPDRRCKLTVARVRQGDPMGLVERAGELAAKLGTSTEGAALWSFRLLLTDGARNGIEKNGTAPAPADVVRDRTREMLSTFTLRALTPTFSRLTAPGQALVEVDGLDPEGRLEQRSVICVLEAGQWKMASGAPRAPSTSRPATRPAAN